MLRFLKKRFKFSKDPVPPEDLTHQNTDIGVECGGDSEGEYRSRDLRADKRPMGLIRPSHQISTTEEVLGSQIRTARARVRSNSFPPRMPRLRLPDKRVTTRVSVAGCSCLGQRPFPFSIALPGRGQVHGGSVTARNEQLGHNTPDLHSAKRDSNQREHESQGPIFQQPSEIARERTIGDCQDGGDAHDIDQAQSGKSRGRTWCSCYTTVCVDHY